MSFNSSSTTAMNILAVGAHPDDIETYCGGTLAKYAALGNKVFMAIATDGCCGSGELSREESAKLREKESRNSAAVIGAELIWMGFEDAMLFDTREVRLRFLDMQRYCKADVVLTHNPVCYSADHEATCRIMRAVDNLVPNVNVVTKHKHDKLAMMYHWERQSGMGFIPTHYVDITEYMDQKIEMMACHKSQVDWMDINYKQTFEGEDNFFEGIVVQSRYRGLQCGVKYAEGFVGVFDAFRVPPGSLLP